MTTTTCVHGREFVRGRVQRGFSIVTAVFLIVVLALLGVFIISMVGLQQTSQSLDLQGVRAYQVLDPNNAQTTALANCSAVPMPACAGGNLNGLAGSLSTFTVSVQCNQTDTTEGTRKVSVYQVIATACNQPAGGACPNASPAPGYVERQVTAVMSKCRDTTASPPRCGCG